MFKSRTHGAEVAALRWYCIFLIFLFSYYAFVSGILNFVQIALFRAEQWITWADLTMTIDEFELYNCCYPDP